MGCRSWVKEATEPRNEGGIFGEGPTGKGESEGGFVGWKRPLISGRHTVGLTCLRMQSTRTLISTMVLVSLILAPKRATIG